VGRGLQLASGRVIALGRLLLATLFLVVIWVDVAQPAQFPVQTYALLIGYVALAAALLLATWSNWWLDANLAGPALAIDIAWFTALVYLTQGDRSPFFPFFIFILLAAAIRWGWRATALSAVLLTLLYFIAGIAAVAAKNQFDADIFIARTGYLVILSLILIWFGVNQWRVRLLGPTDAMLDAVIVDPTPLESSLRAAMAGARASAGALVWSKTHKSRATLLVIMDGELTVSKLESAGAVPAAAAPFLYDQRRGRALMRDPNRNLRPISPTGHVDPQILAALKLDEGLAIPLAVEGARGQLYLERVSGLSIDHLELGAEIAIAVATHLQRQALMRAAEDSAEARSRLAIARDLHDSVVQFLAGAAFRLEAMKRSEATGRTLTPELNELKELMLQEQTELRSFITALRTGSHIELAELGRELQALAARLSRQWDVQCTFSAERNAMTVPTTLYFDAQQLVREAVANAVRHAGAKNVSIRLAGENDEVRLDFINDGAAYPRSGGGRRLPGSMAERVAAAGGVLDLSRGMGVTKVSISLPISGRAA
jgi:signal transduction histidine kinase